MVEGLQPDFEELERHFIAAVPPHGSIGNRALRIKLGWDEDRYWYIRAHLIAVGVLTIGRGRGGSVLFASPGERSIAEQPISNTLRLNEKDLYIPIVSQISAHWALDHAKRDLIVECTAQQGRRNTGGKWTRPDVTIAAFNTFRYLPGVQLELSTFEVKTCDGLDVTAVYEALAQRRAAHYAYVWAYMPDSERTALKSLIDRLSEDASNHGVGIILAEHATDYKTWTFVVEPRRNTPEPSNVNDFIRAQTSAAFRERIVDWCRTV